jgi:hypothetical protein
LTISDRFTRGWASGHVWRFIRGLFGFLPYCIGISTLRLTDWSAILVFGCTPPFSFFDELYALGVLAGTAGGVGVLFAFLLPLITERNIYFKGWIIFLIPWGGDTLPLNRSRKNRRYFEPFCNDNTFRWYIYVDYWISVRLYLSIT